jgi:hypothetical protein
MFNFICLTIYYDAKVRIFFQLPNFFLIYFLHLNKKNSNRPAEVCYFYEVPKIRKVNLWHFFVKDLILLTIVVSPVFYRL